MKKEYLNRLETELEKNGIDDKKEILKKYKKRYEFGLEAEMTEDAIEEMLGEPEEIVRKLKKPNEVLVLTENSKEEETEIDYEMDISLISEDLVFTHSNDDGIHVIFEDLDENDYVIEKNKNKLVLKTKKKNYFGLKRIQGKIYIEIPRNLASKSIRLTSTSGDITGVPLKAKDMKITIVSGDVRLEEIETDKFDLSVVSGDIEIENVLAKDIKIDTVSGDIDFDFMICEQGFMATISGDITINQAKGNIQTSSVSGDILINGSKAGQNVKDFLKGFVRK